MIARVRDGARELEVDLEVLKRCMIDDEKRKLTAVDFLFDVMEIKKR